MRLTLLIWVLTVLLGPVLPVATAYASGSQISAQESDWDMPESTPFAPEESDSRGSNPLVEGAEVGEFLIPHGLDCLAPSLRPIPMGLDPGGLPCQVGWAMERPPRV